MATDPRAALDRLIAAFEAHLDVAGATRDADAPVVLAASNALADAFDAYDDALFRAYGVDTPFDIYDDDSDDEDDDEDERGFDVVDEA